MPVGTPRFIIENHGPDQQPIKIAFAGAIQVCSQLSINRITMLVPTKGSFPGTVVGQMLGKDASKALCSGKTISAAQGITLDLESIKTFSTHGSYGMLFGVYLSDDGIAKLDSAAAASAIVLLPWLEDEGKKWMSTWSPKVLGPSTWQVASISLHPDVTNELLSLTSCVNLSTGILHSSDKQRAKEAFKSIVKAGHHPSPEDIRQWATANGWAPNDAKSLAKLAGQIIR